MSDFFQNGRVTTLHNLSRRPIDEMEAELKRFSRWRPMSLILPSLFSEFSGPALPHIIEQLQPVAYLDQIVMGLDRASEEEYRQALTKMAVLPQHHRLLWNDGPRLLGIDSQLQKKGLAPREMGKGRNVWYCLGYVLATGRAQSVALHDCDIITYDRELLARLFYPVANPSFNYEFCKGYYARMSEGRINGRVSRLLVTPLIRSLKTVIGPHDYLDYLDSFRYPLAGEFSFRVNVIKDIRIPSDWGLEIGVLSEMHRNYATNHLCQVDIADVYDHKHQSVSREDAAQGLSKMSIDITTAIFRKLATQGVVLSKEALRTIKATYLRVALDFIESFHNDAVMNGMHLDIHAEEQAVELFARNIMKAGKHYFGDHKASPFIPSWNRVISAIPDILEQIQEAVELDNQEFAP